jgi:hypothetical protein
LTTTLRVRIALDERPELEKRAMDANQNYRQYLADVLMRAAKRGYHPTSAQHRRETRVPLDVEVKKAVRLVAQEAGLDPEDYAMGVFRDVIQGDFK